MQLALVVVPDQEGVDVCAVRLEAAHHKFLPWAEFHFYPPVAALTGQVARIAALGDDALKTQFSDLPLNVSRGSRQRL
jgi:hypothetical protein